MLFLIFPRHSSLLHCSLLLHIVHFLPAVSSQSCFTCPVLPSVVLSFTVHLSFIPRSWCSSFHSDCAYLKAQGINVLLPFYTFYLVEFYFCENHLSVALPCILHLFFPHLSDIFLRLYSCCAYGIFFILPIISLHPCCLCQNHLKCSFLCEFPSFLSYSGLTFNLSL